MKRKYVAWYINPEISGQFNQAVQKLGAKPNIALETILSHWLDTIYPKVLEGGGDEGN